MVSIKYTKPHRPRLPVMVRWSMPMSFQHHRHHHRHHRHRGPSWRKRLKRTARQLFPMCELHAMGIFTLALIPRPKKASGSARKLRKTPSVNLSSRNGLHRTHLLAAGTLRFAWILHHTLRPWSCSPGGVQTTTPDCTITPRWIRPLI